MIIALYLIAAAAVGGFALFGLYRVLRPRGRVWLPGVVHGLTGIAGFALLLVALRTEPVRGVSMGAGSFGTVAAWFLGAGVLLGSASFVARWRRRPPPGVLVIGSHATLAVAGLTMLAAYLSAS